MGINVEQLKGLIETVLYSIDAKSETAVNLLLGTAAQESHMGQYIEQIKGPALGIFQMEPNTEIDIWSNYLKYSKKFFHKMMDMGYVGPDGLRLIGDLIYQIAMCRIHYHRVPYPLPSDPNDIVALAHYWKQYYNTPLGKGTVEEFEENYKRFVLGG